jgi:dipeptidase D
MSDAIRSLEPRALWNCFADLNAVPRPSKKEAKVKAFVREFAAKHALDCLEDSGGNLIVKKAASADRAGHAPVILQAHLDMVHKAADGVSFDFENQGIEMWIDGDWVRARGTTLGADNGLGAAAILAVLASKDLSHPPIEALLTIDEEQGMSGARMLQSGLLNGKTMLNLDSEEDDEFTIGCAGGIDTLVSWTYPETTHAKATIAEIRVEGLRGGHSGLQIHEGRGNAIKLMARLLAACGAKAVAVAEWRGGSARNAIPARCIARVAVLDEAVFAEKLAEEAQIIREEFQRLEPGLQISSTKLENGSIATLQPESQRVLVLAMQAVVNGVYRMSPEVPGLVEASSNLSLIDLRGGRAEWSGLQRSSVESSKRDVAAAFAAPFRLIGAEVRNDDGYPGWSPSASSAILDQMKGIYRELFGHDVGVSACHAGLECGVIAQTYPGLDMISFGPDIEEAHSENERASISSAQKFWKLLTTTLARL